jgi:alpha-beta hydrolase superfamily lysophospholipase
VTAIGKTISSFPSAGAYTAGGAPAEISVKTWAPPGEPRAVLQLNHGMAEYIDRYERFALAAAGRGYLVVGMDFIGHGDTAPEAGEISHMGISLPGGRNVLVEDMHTLRTTTAAAHPGLPYFLFGHSMGSFALRAYLGQHGDGLAGAIVCGTGHLPPATLRFAQGFLRFLGLVHKPDYRSEFFAQLTLGAHNKPFEKPGPARTKFDWLTRDEAEVDAYVADPRCHVTFSLSANRYLIDAYRRASDPATFAATPAGLPLLLISGSADPVGLMGRSPLKVKELYEASGHSDVTLNLYDGARHELLNEVNRDDVTRDVLEWLEAKTR